MINAAVWMAIVTTIVALELSMSIDCAQVIGTIAISSVYIILGIACDVMIREKCQRRK